MAEKEKALISFDSLRLICKKIPTGLSFHQALVQESTPHEISCEIFDEGKKLTTFTFNKWGGSLSLGPTAEVNIDQAHFKLRAPMKPFDVDFEWG
jgi:hypothetical protein